MSRGKFSFGAVRRLCNKCPWPSFAIYTLRPAHLPLNIKRSITRHSHPSSLPAINHGHRCIHVQSLKAISARRGGYWPRSDAFLLFLRCLANPKSKTLVPSQRFPNSMSQIQTPIQSTLNQVFHWRSRSRPHTPAPTDNVLNRDSEDHRLAAASAPTLLTDLTAPSTSALSNISDDEELTSASIPSKSGAFASTMLVAEESATSLAPALLKASSASSAHEKPARSGPGDAQHDTQ